MATSAEHDEQSVSRGLLTESERDVLRGERDDVDYDSYVYNIRSRFRNRMDELEEDLELLEAADENELVQDFYARFGKVERLERELEALREQIDDQD